MAEYGLFIGWDRPIAGRERHMTELFGSFMNFFESKKKAGLIEAYEPVLMTVHAGDLNGFFIVRGEPKKLHEVRHLEEFNELVLRANALVTKLGVVQIYLGEKVKTQIDKFIKTVPV